MAQDDPFTIDLFGNTALSSGLGLGVTAFAGDFTVESNDDDDPEPPTPAPAAARQALAPSASTEERLRGSNFHLAGDRALAKGWKARARDNIAAIRLAAEIAADDRHATAEEQASLIRFTGFGASDLANGVFRRPGETTFRKSWEELGAELQEAVSEGTTPRSPAAHNMPISRRSSSSARSGPGSSASAGAAVAWSSPASVRASFRH